MILSHLKPSDTVLDVGCGRRAPNLIKLKGQARVLIGLDMVDFEIEDSNLVLLTGSVCHMSDISDVDFQWQT